MQRQTQSRVGMEDFARAGPEKVSSCKAWNRLVSPRDKKEFRALVCTQNWSKDQRGSGRTGASRSTPSAPQQPRSTQGGQLV